MGSGKTWQHNLALAGLPSGAGPAGAAGWSRKSTIGAITAPGGRRASGRQRGRGAVGGRATARRSCGCDVGARPWTPWVWRAAIDGRRCREQLLTFGGRPNGRRGTMTMTRRYFGTDGPWRGGPDPITPTSCSGRAAGRARSLATPGGNRRCDRQGHPHLGLHAGRRSKPASSAASTSPARRPAADAGVVPDARALEPRRGDLSASHNPTTTTASSSFARGSKLPDDLGAGVEAALDDRPSGPRPPRSARRAASGRRGRYVPSSARARCRTTLSLRGMKSSSTARTAPHTTSRRTSSTSRRRRWSLIGVEPDGLNINDGAAVDGTQQELLQRGGGTAPTRHRARRRRRPPAGDGRPRRPPVTTATSCST